MLDWFFPLSRIPADYAVPPRIYLRSTVRIIRYEWRIIVGSAFLAGLLGLAYCLITPPQYQASVQIVPGDFTTKSTSGAASGLATLLLNSSTQSDAVKRFITVLYSPDLARRLAQQYPAAIAGSAKPDTGFDGRVSEFESALSHITSTEGKESLATTFTYRSTDPNKARDFLKLAVMRGDQLLRQYNLSEIRYDDTYLNNVLANAQNVDVRMALAQKLVDTQLRRMDAQRAEYFSIRTLGPVEVDANPVWPRKKLILGGMLLFGALVGFVSIFIRLYAGQHRDAYVA